MFVIVTYRGGRARRHRFATLDAARAAANEIWARTGVIVGIEEE